jgi:hypothetical protein
MFMGLREGAGVTSSSGCARLTVAIEGGSEKRHEGQRMLTKINEKTKPTENRRHRARLLSFEIIAFRKLISTGTASRSMIES